ncbi:MAG: flagellar assembly protein FliW [Lachnospiraceae bacterium]|nr:flagellar assembly protein FliW [Lachnospiraceae bacterium]
MIVKTKIFGEIEVDESRFINFEDGILGFPDLKRFMLIHDEESGGANLISWMQSIDEPAFAMPVIDPLKVCSEYNPEVEDELLINLGDVQGDDILVLTTVTVPPEIEKMTANLRAPFIINASNLKACQIILEDEKYLIKYPIYDVLKSNKE